MLVTTSESPRSSGRGLIEAEPHCRIQPLGRYHRDLRVAASLKPLDGVILVNPWDQSPRSSGRGLIEAACDWFSFRTPATSPRSSGRGLIEALRFMAIFMIPILITAIFGSRPSLKR